MTSQGDRVINVGFVGCGRATQMLHLPALRSLEGVEIVGLADTDPAALERAARLVHARHQVPDYRALLDVATLDVVAICVPAGQHVEVALDVLDAGKHVFIEKPLALSLEDCDRLIARAATNSSVVMVGFNTRWHRLVQLARRAVEEGRLGPLDVVHSILTGHHQTVPDWRKARASGGGALLEMAMHHFDLWRYLLQAEVDEVCAYARSGTWDDESATVMARLSNGVLATAAFAERSVQDNAMEICGQRGSLSLAFYRFDGLAWRSPRSIPGDGSSRLDAAKRFVTGLPHAVAGLREGGEWARSYREQWRQYLASVRDGASPGCTLDDGRRALAVALATIESASTGRSVRVADGATRSA